MTYELIKEPEYRYHGDQWTDVGPEHRRTDPPFTLDRSRVRETPKCKPVPTVEAGE